MTNDQLPKLNHVSPFHVGFFPFKERFKRCPNALSGWRTSRHIDIDWNNLMHRQYAIEQFRYNSWLMRQLPPGICQFDISAFEDGFSSPQHISHTRNVGRHSTIP